MGRSSRKQVTKTNTVERELGLVIHQYTNEMLCDYKSSELREHLSDLFWAGTKGYGQMTREELLHEINNEIVENFEAETLDRTALLQR